MMWLNLKWSCDNAVMVMNVLYEVCSFAKRPKHLEDAITVLSTCMFYILYVYINTVAVLGPSVGVNHPQS